MHARDADELVDVLVRPGRRERGVASAVELRPGVVGHATVDRDPGTARQALDAADAVQGHTRAADETTTRLEPDLGVGSLPRRRPPARSRRRSRRAPLPPGPCRTGDAGCRSRRRDRRRARPSRARRGRLPRRPRAARSSPPGRRSPRAASRRGRGRRARRDRGRARPPPGRAPALPAARTSTRDARSDRLVGVRVDAERDADERPLHACRGGELRLVRRVEHDGCAERRRLGEEGRVLVVPVYDEVVAGEPCRLRECELAADATSAPTPSSRRSRRSATFGRAFVPKKTRPSPTAARSARAWARSVASQRTTSGVPCSSASREAAIPPMAGARPARRPSRGRDRGWRRPDRGQTVAAA